MEVTQMAKTAKKAAKPPVNPPKIYSAYDRPPSDPITYGGQPSAAKQSFKDEVDINNIVAKFQTTGQLPHVSDAEPNYGYAPALDYHEAMNLVIRSRETFDALPVETRHALDYSVENMLSLVSDSERADEARELGLLPPLQMDEVPSEPATSDPARLEVQTQGDASSAPESKSGAEQHS